MTEFRDVLFELGTEELPPKSLLTLSRSLGQLVDEGLAKAGIRHGGIEPYASPRRLALLIREVAVSQPDQEVERRGPAANAAFQADGSPSKALEGFLKSAGASVGDLLTLETDKGAWVAVRQVVKGVETREFLPELFRQALAGLPIAKRMRWGNGTAEFVRPVHWVVLLFGAEVVPTEILGVETGRTSRGHRFHCKTAIEFKVPTDYLETLEHSGFVIADFDRRRAAIRRQAEEAAASVGGVAVIDADLLDEVTALVEWPVPVLGNIEARFLTLPAEVLITTLQANQKYFPIRARDGRLLPHFITFSNLASSRLETVREGNERVVRPRLSDAEFFWNLDRKRTLESRVDDLANVTFQKVLGSLLDKTHRVVHLSGAIARKLDVDAALAERAARLAKADLLTTMVGEFPELQGTMGRYYAAAEGEPSAIAEAIEEQYLPKVSGGDLPSTPVGQVVALAEKLDTLTGIFSAGLIPTGDKDPYALRRAALGVIRISIEGGLDLDLAHWVSEALSPLTHAFDRDKTCELVLNFIHDRLRGYLVERGARPDEFDAVLGVNPQSLVDFERRLAAVRDFRMLPEAESLSAANKRIRNILRKSEEPRVATVDESILQDPLEKTLLQAARDAREATTTLLAEGHYGAALKRLASLREPVDAFFEGVMVMADDPALKANRIGLLSIIEGLFLDIADISRLQG